MGESYQKSQALQSTESTATLIHAIIRHTYGEEAYDWDPLTVALEVQADFATEMSAEAVDRWSAITVVMTTDAFFKRLDAFLAICNTLNTGAPFFSVFDPVTTEEAAWAITEVALNRELLPFSYPIKQYLKRILAADGYGENDYPDIFREVFERHPSAQDVKEGLAATENRTNVDAYIDEQLHDLVSQFDKIDDLKTVDNLLMERSFEEALNGAK